MKVERNSLRCASVGTRDCLETSSQRDRTTTAKRAWRAAVACIVLAACAHAPQASAATPLISLVGPDEWDLPIVKSANLFLQSAFAQDSTAFYDLNHNSRRLSTLGVPGFHVYAGVTRFAHMFSFDSLPQVGFGIEYLQPLIDVQTPGQSTTGAGDPLFELGAYFKPLPNLTLGYLNVPTIPVGSDQLSSHFWSDTSAIIWNYHVARFGFNGTLAYSKASSQHEDGKDTRIGDSYGAQVTAFYQLNRWVAPLVGYVDSHTGGARDAASGVSEPGQGPLLYGCLLPGGCTEHLAGGGLDFHIPSKHHLSIWYYSAIDGSNVIKTKALYLFYIHPL
jgi:hypothetical protein